MSNKTKLRSMLNNVINDKMTEAKMDLHSYLTSKMIEVSKLRVSEAVESFKGKTIQQHLAAFKKDKVDDADSVKGETFKPAHFEKVKYYFAAEGEVIKGVLLGKFGSEELIFVTGVENQEGKSVKNDDTYLIIDPAEMEKFTGRLADQGVAKDYVISFIGEQSLTSKASFFKINSKGGTYYNAWKLDDFRKFVDSSDFKKLNEDLKDEGLTIEGIDFYSVSFEAKSDKIEYSVDAELSFSRGKLTKKAKQIVMDFIASKIWKNHENGAFTNVKTMISRD